VIKILFEENFNFGPAVTEDTIDGNIPCQGFGYQDHSNILVDPHREPLTVNADPQLSTYKITQTSLTTGSLANPVFRNGNKPICKLYRFKDVTRKTYL
jgi:hypothetical protein